MSDDGCKSRSGVGCQLFVKHTSKVLTKQAGKKLVVNYVTRQVTKQATKAAVSQGTKSFIKGAVAPVSLGADLAQAGLECAGYPKTGKVVGVAGNAAAGAMIAAPLGPVGMAAGALVGVAVWGTGEAVGGLVDTAFETTSSTESGGAAKRGDRRKLQEVFKKLIPLAEEWYNIGFLLDIDDDILQDIKYTEARDSDRLRVMLSVYFETPSPTLESVADAVKAFDKEIAQKIRNCSETILVDASNFDYKG